MNPYESLFADQPIEEVLKEADFPPASPLAVARARMWEGRILEAANAAQGGLEPWASLIVGSARTQMGQDGRRYFKGIAEDASAESRVRLWAWHALRALGDKPSSMFASEVLGVVVEVPIDDDGLDVLAVYADGRARYLTHDDRMIVREGTRGEVDANSAAVLKYADILLRIPPAPRDPEAEAPPPESVRFTGLSAQGLHRVEVPWADVEKGGRYEALFVAATAVLADIATA